MPETLLRTKLFVPPFRPNRVPRPQLIARLNQGLQLGHKLTLISAPAGFGKTTLVGDWMRALPRNGANDNQPANRPAWLSVGGMTIGIESDCDGQPVTTLTGTIDQAALQGLLRRLYSLGMPLLSVICVAND